MMYVLEDLYVNLTANLEIGLLPETPNGSFPMVLLQRLWYVIFEIRVVFA